MRRPYLKFSGRHLGFFTSGFLPLLTFISITLFRGMSKAESVDIVVGSLFSSSLDLELKIYIMLYAVYKLCLLLPVSSHHIGQLVGVKFILVSSSCRVQEVNKAFP